MFVDWDGASDLYQDGMMRLYSPAHHQVNIVVFNSNQYHFLGTAKGLKKMMKWISDAALEMQFLGK